MILKIVCKTAKRNCTPFLLNNQHSVWLERHFTGIAEIRTGIPASLNFLRLSFHNRGSSFYLFGDVSRHARLNEPAYCKAIMDKRDY